jgi:hypothetical protein
MIKFSLRICPDPYVFGPPGAGFISTGTDPAPDPSIIKQK